MTQTDQQNVPKLRFPGFVAEWETRQFSEFLIPDFRDVPKPSENYLALGVRSHGKGTFQKPGSEPDKIAMETLYEVHANDLIVNITFAWEGAIAIAKSHDHGGLVSHRFPTYTFEREHVIHEFFEYIIEDRRFRQTLELISPGGAGRNRVLSKKAFINIEHRFPTLPEQRKIASFLGAVDTKIAQLSRKKALLEDYKKGCMQQLFSQKIRFKDDDGNDFPDWEEKRLGECLSWIKDGTHGTHPDDPCGDFYLLSAKNIKERKIVLGNSERKISEAEFKKISKNYKLQQNDILLTIVGSIGEVALFKADENIVFQRSVAFLRLKAGVALFFLHLFTGIYFQNELKRRQVVSAQPGIYLGDMKKIPLILPHPDEQRKIADFLSAIDRKIELVGQELEHAKTFKKGLLQQMFV